MDGPSGIHVAPNYTVTIQGNGTLHAATKGGGAAIGSGYSAENGNRNAGNIVINGGTIYANGGNLGAGIGGGGRATIGNITINGGIIYAVGGGTGAGIGGGQSKSNSWKSICGNITISSNVKYLKATKGSGAAHSIGKGSSSYSVCGTVTIPGGATGYVSTSPYVYCNPDYVIELINAIPQPVVYTDECKAAIDEARAMYTALTDDQKTSVTNYSTLTDAEAAYAALPVEDKIAAIGTVEYTAECKAKIDAARTAYDALSDEVKAHVGNYTTLTDAETAYAALIKAEADKVIAKINNIPTPVELKLATRDSIQNARTAYDALNAAQQALVSNYQILLDAEAALAEKNKGGSIPMDIVWDGNTGIANVDPNTTSPAYEGMTVTVGQGSSFSTYQSRLYFTFYSQPNGGFIFANENGTNITKVVIESTTALTSTMTEVDRMGSGWVISNENKTATWTGNTDSVSIWKGQSFTNYWVVDMITFTVNGVGATPLDSAQAVKDLIDAIPVPVTLDSKDEIDAARDAYDALADLTKGALDNATVKKLTDAEDAYAALIKEATDVIALINAIPQPVVYNEACGDSIAAAREAYDALSDELKPLVTNYPVLTDAEATYEALAPRIWTSGDCQVIYWPGDSAMIVSKLPGEGNGVMDNYANKNSVPWVDYQLKVKTLTIESGVTEIGSCAFYDLRNLEGGLVIPEGVTAIHENGFRNSLKLTSITLPSTITLLGDNADAFNNCAAANISITADPNKLAWNEDFDDFIYSYTKPDVHKTTVCHVPVDFYEIYVAKFDQTVNVTFVGDLPAALSPAEHAAIEAVKDSIAAIGAEITYPESGAAIDAARSAYDALDDDLKPFVSNYQTLLDAEDAYADAKQAHDAVAAAVVDKINAIPVPVEYSSKAAIDTARVAYDALLDTQKALITPEQLKVLTDAEAAWAAIAAKVEHNVSYIGKDGELKHETVALLHIPDPAPDFNGYEFVRWDVKAGDFLEEGLRVKAVYTPIITTNPQGFDTLAYNGLAQELVKAGVAKEGHIEYSLYPEESESWSAELPKATIAGVYAIYYKLVREGHADYIAPEPTMATIAKVPVTYVAPIAYDTLVYTASNQTLIAAGQTQDGTFWYSLNPTDDNSWKTELPQAMSAGTHNVYYRVQGDINHLDSTAVDPIAVTIAKAALTATADDKNVIYGDAVPAYTVTYAGWQGTDDASVLTGDIAFACEYASTSNVGEYTITPSGVDAANYNITFVNGKVTVAKAESGCVAPVAYDTLVYNGANQTLIIAGQPMGGEMQYSLDTTVLDCWSTSLPQAKDAGTYNVYYRVKGDMNHNDHYYDLIAVSIAKAALTATAEDKTVTYGDAAPEYTVSYSGWMGTDEASVLTGTIAFACEYAPTSNVGKYTITPSGVDAANYSITFVNGKVTVNKADLMITADDKFVIYGEVAPAFTASYSGWKNSDDESVVSGLTLTSEYLVTSNVGTYDIVPANASATNYAISFTNGTLTVNQAALTITANDTVMIYGDEHPEFTVTYAGWKNTDDESVVSGLQFSTPYAPGSYIGTYAINPNSATALNYAITFVDGTLTVNKAHVYVSDAEAQIAKFADGHANAVVLKQGTLNGIKLNDPIAHVTTAAFSSADVAENLTLTLFYELTGDAALLNNYNLDPTSDIFTTEGVIIEPFIPDNEEKPEDQEATVKEGIEIYAYGYCDGSGYSLKYHLESGNPDQYKIDFADSRFTDVDWTNLEITGKDGTIDIEIPVDLPTGDYTMTVYFRDSRFDWLESRQFNVTFHVNLPETYVRPLFDNVIALVDTCNCLTDIQWYWRANSSEPWQPIEGANGYYYHSEGKLTGEYFVSAKMNGEPTYTCGQADMETLYGAGQQAQAPVVRAYPNPVVNTTTVTIENSDNFEHNLRVVNLMGAEVMNTTFEGNETNVEMSGYPQGNYMISVDGIVVKVMKQ
ncbi:MAG: leucine-rich repeat protein [Paludibacteraceae bacterium]|nr:leucine-rich repeat protein [Paludibacteraceae bacterium]